jgi:magnesium transporter
MITIRKDIATRFASANSEPTNYTWVDAREVTRDDINELQETYGIEPELLADIMDLDEQSRIEKEENYVALIARLPAFADDSHGINQYCVPLGIVMMKDTIITICQSDSVILEDFARSRFRQYPIQTQEGFVISLMGRAAMVYIRLLKYLNRQKSLIEEELYKVVRNEELLQLLAIQKSLVYFATSLQANEALLERMRRSPFFKVNDERERQFLEDVIIDNKQAIEMAGIYSSILTGTMESFDSVISNNMSNSLRRLTVVAISFMFPLFLVGLFGMNLNLPFQNSPYTILSVLALALASVFVSIYLISDRRSIKKIERQIEAERRRKEKRRSSSRRKRLARES